MLAQLKHTPLIRNTYRAIFNRKWAVEYSQMRAFYAQFFGKRDLVFDIGANVGEYSDIFSELGARVVAVEPNPSCCEFLYQLARLRDVRVEGCAVGEKVGNATLRRCSESYFSTLNEKWLEQTKDSPVYRSVKWLDPIDVPVTTVDSLIRRHGKPTFIKIDVEGFEANVIRGMSHPPLPEF